MTAHKQIDRICAAVTVLTLLLTVLFMAGGVLGVETVGRVMGYENRLFDTTRVHAIDIVMEDWQGFLAACENEEYAACSVIIDGEAYKNVGLRAKGNTSLSSVARTGSSRYSFKVEFDQYDSTKSYHGLDKLSLNNLIQDNTLMKDYLTYRMMAEFGAAAPLCSYAFLTVNGEDWGLYLAVEALEESFLQRNYGMDYGDLYKPDSLSFGGGRGNGRNFNMDEFTRNFTGNAAAAQGARKTASNSAGTFAPGGERNTNTGGGRMGFGMGSGDVKLQYIDDDPASYSNIFGSAKTDVTQADQDRLIASLKKLSAREDLENVVDVDAVLRYFVVHNFVCNGDSYTGSMIHNYYLYEEYGLLSMLPWDYNLAFGSFQSVNASNAVNESVDFSLGDRPMADWIFDSEPYTARYHEYYAEFLRIVDAGSIISDAAALIAPYVERDPTKFCTVEAFERGVEALKTFCALRRQSASGQLAGDHTPVDTTGLNLSDMGSMGMGGGGWQMGGNRTPQGQTGGEMFRPDRDRTGNTALPSGETGFAALTSAAEPSIPSGAMPEGMQRPAQGGWGQMTPPATSGSQEGDTTQTPSGNGGWGSFGDFTGGGMFPGGQIGSTAGSSGPLSGSSVQWILLGASVLILAAGLLFAWKFRR